MNRTFKIVGRYSGRERWSHGKIGTQSKKTVYTSLADYERYGPETSARWKKSCGYDVEHYEMIAGKWKLI